MRPGATTAIALAIAAATGACGKKGGGSGGGAAKPVLEQTLMHQSSNLAGTKLDIVVPEAMGGGTLNMNTLRYTIDGTDKLDVTIDTVTPVVLQNEVNALNQTDARVTRSEETADGWIVTSGDAAGKTLTSKRQVKVSDTKALRCLTVATWGTPDHSQKRIDFVEAICSSLTVKPQ